MVILCHNSNAYVNKIDLIRLYSIRHGLTGSTCGPAYLERAVPLESVSVPTMSTPAGTSANGTALLLIGPAERLRNLLGARFYSHIIFDNAYTIVYNIIMLVKLGTELRKARDQMGVSLQAIADTANISTAYLQKLERGEVSTPSPRVLRRLASSVGLPYLGLMELAEYLDKEELAEARLREPSPRPHPLAGQRLTPEEWRAVGAFIKTLVAERKTQVAEPDSFG
jgi:transcriptional regulator with XRE-family HTH domain